MLNWKFSKSLIAWAVLLSIYLMLYVTTVSADADERIEVTKARMRITHDNLSLPGDEKMGFLGGTFLYDANEWLSVGPGAYGAVTGERGGFITLGLGAELRKPISKNIDGQTGIFVGAGGGRGGLALSGGGLMLRSHAGLNIKLSDLWNLGLGISHVSFPYGTVDSTQPYLAIEVPFKTIIGSGWIDHKSGLDETRGHPFENKQSFSITYRRYSIPEKVKRDSGGKQYPTINLMGAEWNKMLTENWYLSLSTEGAMGGQSTGYMQILSGAGYRYPLISKTNIKISASAGVAGGGAVSTGGGSILSTSLALQQMVTNHLFVEVEGAYVSAPDGDFEAKSVALKTGYAFSTPAAKEDDISPGDLGDYDAVHLRMRSAYQKYFKAAPEWRSHHSNLNVENLGIQMDYFPGENYYLTGQGMAAYKGKAGAYMTGLLGGGVHLPISDGPIFIDGEALAGAAGGGGLSMGGGLVWQANAGVGYNISDKYSVICSYGRMEAPKGKFKANVVSLSFAYRFTLFAK